MEAGPREKGRREGWAVAKPAGFNAARHTGEVDEALRQTCMSLWASARMDLSSTLGWREREAGRV